MVDLRMAGKIDLAGDLDTFVLRLHAVELDSGRGCDRLDSFKPSEEIEMPPGTAEFTIRGKFESNLLLLFDDFFDFTVFNRFQHRSIDFALGSFRSRFLQRRRPQQAADMISAEGRCCTLGHDYFDPIFRRRFGRASTTPGTKTSQTNERA